MTQCKPPAFLFQDLGSREVSACFDGGQVTSDAGGLLLREVERRFGFIASFARCFTDHRDPELIEHTLEQLLKQRIFALCLGYEDLNDHEQLRHDPLLAVLVGKLDPQGQDRVSPRDRGKALAGKSTLNRLELTPVGANADSRYKKIVGHVDAMQTFLVEAFLQQHAVAPERIVLDVDATDNPLHGHQLGRFFHGYYDSYCYLPLYIFCGDHPLLALLRPSNIDTPTGLLKHLIRIVAQIRQRWPHVQIVLRGDSGFCREYLMHWCETNRVDYLFGLPKNERLLRILGKELQEAKDLFAQTKLAARVFKDFDYRTHKTWSRPRRVVGKAEHLAKGANPRFVVTSLTAIAYPALMLYEEEYCGRGDMENRIKEQQLFLFACRVSCATMRANQLRILLSTVAYIVMRALRQFGLQQTELAHAQCDTIRLKLLKIGAIIRISVRRVYVSLSESYPFRSVFLRVYENLCQVALPVPAVVPSG
jgi:Transposase DDE domain group 1